MPNSASWFFWALLSALFAALTAVFAKIGIREVDSDLATLIRTGVIIVILAAFVPLAGKWTNPLALSAKTWFVPCSLLGGDWRFVGVLFPCIASRRGSQGRGG